MLLKLATHLAPFLLLLLPQTTLSITIPAKTCSLPAPGQDFQSATPAQVNIRQAAVDKAIAYANTHARISIQIFRHNCRIAQGLLDPVTDQVANNVWSVTKSVVSLLTGIAVDQGKLSLDDQIGKYLPKNPGWGNKRHRALTVRQLLTETAGFSEAIVAEAGTVILDPSLPQEALAQPFEHPPGTHFEYAQRVPDLLIYVVSRAVGMEAQAFAQKYLFDPIGIPQDSYFWLRDRSSNTYGYAFLFIPPTQLAKLGLLTINKGAWNGKQVVSTTYLANATASSPRNPCYGFLFWVNKGQVCTAANIPSAQTYYRRAVPAAPKDLFMMVGALQQNNFMIPSLGITVTWTGFFGDTEPNLAAILSAAPADLYNNFFAILLAGVQDAKVPSYGFLPPDNLTLDIDPFNYASPAVLLNDAFASPSCNVLFCNGGVPADGLLANIRSLANLILATIP